MGKHYTLDEVALLIGVTRPKLVAILKETGFIRKDSRPGEPYPTKTNLENDIFKMVEVGTGSKAANIMKKNPENEFIAKNAATRLKVFTSQVGLEVLRVTVKEYLDREQAQNAAEKLARQAKQKAEREKKKLLASQSKEANAKRQQELAEAKKTAEEYLQKSQISRTKKLDAIFEEVEAAPKKKKDPIQGQIKMK